MQYNKTYGSSESDAFSMYTFLFNISEILNRDNSSQNLIIAAYLLEQKRFFFCNKALENILGSKIDQFHQRGWDFWFANMCTERSMRVKNQISDFLFDPFNRNPLTLKYHIHDGTENKICLKHEMIIHKQAEHTFVINYIFDMSERERLERYLKGANGHTRSTPSVTPKPISAREEEVLKLIADGYSSKQIANRLFISNHTAISHRKHLIEKFQVRNTAQLIKRASKVMEL